MRMLLKVQIPVEAGNAAVSEGKMPQIVQGAMEKLKPEAAYFLSLGGVRTALFVFDMADPSQIPVVAEPFFTGANASVELLPVMTAEELQAGLAQLGG
jgi:hypothetical protein